MSTTVNRLPKKCVEQRISRSILQESSIYRKKQRSARTNCTSSIKVEFSVADTENKLMFICDESKK